MPEEEERGLEGRVGNLETCLSEIRRDLQVLLRGPALGGPSAGAATQETPVSRRAKAKASAATPAPMVPPPPGLPDPQLKGLDAGVVRTAQEAGISTSHLAEMARLVREKGKGLKDEPQKAQTRPNDVLDDDAYGGEEATSPQLPGDPIAAAVVRLTEIASQLTVQKRKDTSLDAVLDNSGGSGGVESTGGSTSRKNAAALRLLKERMRSHPRELAENIEHRMSLPSGPLFRGPLRFQ